jgi:hypothetical protein
MNGEADKHANRQMEQNTYALLNKRHNDRHIRIDKQTDRPIKLKKDKQMNNKYKDSHIGMNRETYEKLRREGQTDKQICGWISIPTGR